MSSIASLISIQDDQSRIRLGRQIRDLRKSKGITQTYLAEQTGKSIGYISQLERGISSVSIPVLQKISDILGVNITWFFHTENEQVTDESDHIVRSGNRRQLKFFGSGIKEELLSPWMNGDFLMILTTFSAGAHTDPEPRKRNGDEAGYIQSGRIELILGDKVFELGVGDSFSIKETENYHLRNLSDTEQATIVWVLPSASY